VQWTLSWPVLHKTASKDTDIPVQAQRAPTNWGSQVRLSAVGTGRFTSLKNLNYPIRNRTRNLMGCSAMPQPTALPRARAAYLIPRTSHAWPVWWLFTKQYEWMKEWIFSQHLSTVNGEDLWLLNSELTNSMMYYPSSDGNRKDPSRTLCNPSIKVKFTPKRPWGPRGE
jgi:hypothetical protein